MLGVTSAACRLIFAPTSVPHGHHITRRLPYIGAQFTCFTSTNVQILTPEELRRGRLTAFALLVQKYLLTGTKVQILTPDCIVKIWDTKDASCLRSIKHPAPVNCLSLEVCVCLSVCLSV